MLVEEVLTLRVEDIGHLYGGPAHDSVGFRFRRDRGTTGTSGVRRKGDSCYTHIHSSDIVRFIPRSSSPH